MSFNPGTWRKAVAGAILVAGASGVFWWGAGGTGAPTGGGGGGSASVFLATGGTDTGSCATSGTACASLNYGLSKVSAGGTIQLAAGTYGTAFGCTSTGVGRNYFVVGASFGSDVTVTVASAATVIIPCQIDLGFTGSATANHVGFDGTGGTLRIDGIRIDSDHNFLKNVDIFCADAAPYPLSTVTNLDAAVPNPPAGGSHSFCSAPINGNGTNFTMTGGSIGPTTTDGCTGDGASANCNLQDSNFGAGGNAHDFVLNGVYSHDARWGDDCNGGAQSCHTENFTLRGVNNFTFKNMLFKFCGDSACMFVGSTGGSSAESTNIVLANSVCVGNNLNMEEGTTVTYQNDWCGYHLGNSGTSSGMTGASFTITNSIVYGNSCDEAGNAGLWEPYMHASNNIYMYDTSTGGSADLCQAGNGNVQYNPSHAPTNDIFVNNGSGDYHLKSGAACTTTGSGGSSPSPAGCNPAIDRGNSALCLAASPDYYGLARYQGTAPDDGPSERADGGGAACSG